MGASNNVIYFPRVKVASPDGHRERGSWQFVSICLVSILFFATCFVIDVHIILPRKDCNLSVRGPCKANFAADNASLGVASKDVTPDRAIQR